MERRLGGQQDPSSWGQHSRQLVDRADRRRPARSCSEAHQLAGPGRQTDDSLLAVQVCVLGPAVHPPGSGGEHLNLGTQLVTATQRAQDGDHQSDRIPTRDGFSGRQLRHRTRRRPAFALVRGGVEPPAGIEPATPSLPWNHREPLCGTPFPQVTSDRQGRSYRFSFGEVMGSVSSLRMAIVAPLVKRN
jgi:hypothetical protein